MIFNDDFIAKVSAELDENRPIRYKFPLWGRIHIDRRLPFLCIYRRPAGRSDKGSERLLLGQASYILLREEDADCSGFRKLVKAILRRFSADFGSALLFELWSEQAATSVTPELQNAAFKIKADKHRVPCAMLEELEGALLAIPFSKRSISVSLDYSAQCSPPWMSQLLSRDELIASSCYWVGLSTAPIYRQEQQILPYMLQRLHHCLTQVLQRSFYSFTHNYSQHRPAHFHELGQRALTRAVWSTDKQLAEIKAQFDILLHVTPVNADEAWSEFSANGFSQAPSFNYRPRAIAPERLKRQLFAIAIEKVEDPTLAHIFRSQRDEIDRQLNMINDRNKKNFLYGSLQVFGGVTPALLSLAEKILTEVPAQPSAAQSSYLSAEQFAQRAEKLVAYYRNEVPEFQSRVEIREDVPGILVSRGNLLIGQNSRFSANGVEATLAHEVGTHMLTYFNGKRQPFQQFYTGMANYEPLQEGLAVLSEYLVGELQASRLRTLAARVVAVHALIRGDDFIETFILLHRGFSLSARRAFDITMRAYRGGGFTKDAVYLKGLCDLLDYLGKGGDLDILFLGKIAQEDIPFVEELQWRQVLKEGLLIPHYLKTEQSKMRLRALRNKASVLDLIKGK